MKKPIHLVKELEIIDDALDRVKTKLKNSDCKKVYIIADHGATRLAVINDNILKIDALTRGEHGGRVCDAVDGIEKKIPEAMRVGNKLVLANYDMFAGAKRPSVEVHGGATLEEISVPVIRLELKSDSIKYEIILKEDHIQMMPGVVPVIEFYSPDNIDNVTVKIDDKFYKAQSSDGKNYSAELNGLESGEYSFDVYENNNLIKSNLNFSLEGAASQSNDFMSNFDF